MTETTQHAVSGKAGAAERLRHRNPFYTPLGIGLTVTLAAIAISFFGYSLLIGALSTSLVRSIEMADTPLEVLRESAPYTVPRDMLTPSEDDVDDLAIATWIKHYKLAAPSADLSAILEDPKFELLRAAIRYGDHCPVANGEAEPLRMTTIKRIVALAQFLGGADCGTMAGQGPQTASMGLVARNIAGLLPLGEVRNDAQLVAVRCPVGHPVQLETAPTPGRPEAAVGCVDIFNSVPQMSGKALFRVLLDRVAAFKDLTTEPVQRRPVFQEKFGPANDAAIAANALLNTETTELDAANAGGDQPAKDTALGEWNTAKANADAADAALRAVTDAYIKPNDEQAMQDTARLTLHELNLKRQPGKEPAIEDPQIQAIEDYAVALMASVDTDASVASARQLLAAARGIEQFLIIALFLVVGALMLERFVAFWNIERRVNTAVADLGTLTDPPLPPRKPADLAGLRADKAAVALSRHAGIGGLTVYGGPEHRRVSELVDDMVKAVKADLSQIGLYGLSDEQTQAVADGLKDKLSSSRQILDWGITTLPALGFLGTVHGILNALNGVSGLTQGDAASRLATLLDVSGALGLAFSTTLIALVGMMILSYFDVVQERRERAIVEEFRDFLSDRFLS